MRCTLLLILALTHSASAAARAGGIMKQLKGDPAEVGKQRAQLQREVDAILRGEDPDAPPAEEAPAADDAPTPAADDAPASKPKPAKKAGGGLRINLKRLPVPLVLAAGGWRALAVWRWRQAEAAVIAAASALEALTGAAPSCEAPSDGPRDPAARLALASELEARHDALKGTVLPALAQLSQRPPKALAERPAAELQTLGAALKARVDACASVLSGYEAIGQPPPPDFKSWPPELLHARAANLTAKAAPLRRIAELEARLGRKNLDWEVAALDDAALAARIAQLEPQVAEREATTEKEELIGKVEAALWMKGQEVPIGLPMKNTTELRAILKKLKRAAE